MKTKTALITGVLTGICLMITINLFAGDKNTWSDTTNANTVDRSDNNQKISVSDSSKVFNIYLNENRQYLDDLVALPWMIQEVVIRPVKKSNNNAKKKEEGYCQTAYK